MESQQHLLTAIQEGKFSITGQSERSSGAMVKTDPVPCDFIMVLAGNLDAMEGMHPALRSRIKGYGYELFMQDTMEDNQETRRRLVRFVGTRLMQAAAHCGGSSPTRVGCKPVLSANVGTSTQQPGGRFVM
jgi:Lon-like ATP-dependent protease